MKTIITFLGISFLVLVLLGLYCYFGHKSRADMQKRLKIISSFSFVSVVASWFTVKVCFTFYTYIKALWHIDEVNYFHDIDYFHKFHKKIDLWVFYTESYFTIFFVALIVITAIVLSISRIHECKHKYDLHERATNSNPPGCVYP